MKNYTAAIKKIISGSARFTDKQKVSAIVYSVMVIHIVLAVTFGLCKVYPLFILHCISVLIYPTCIHFIQQKLLWPIYYITYIDIIIHTFMATILIGWQCGFNQYIIAMIPVGYFLDYIYKNRPHNMTIATVSALFSTVAYLCCKILSYNVVPVYGSYVHSLELILHIFNSICTFSFLIAFCLIFISEMNWSNIQLHHQNEILEKLASTDPLTGLYNRRSMDIFLQQAFKSSTGFSVIMCDIDDFKKVNDTYGHDCGDIVLREIAQIITQLVDSNGYVCRWGGEEILILVSGSTHASARYIAELIRRQVAGHIFKLNDKEVHCTLTLGVSVYREGASVEETITMADGNLYKGKRSGKNIVVA